MTLSGRDEHRSTLVLKVAMHATAKTDEPMRAVREHNRWEPCANLAFISS